MHLERKPRSESESAFKFATTKLIILVVAAYALGAVVSARNIIIHSQASTHAIEQILLHYNMQNEGAQALDRFDKQNPFLGLFVASPIRHNLELPSDAEANQALYSDVKHFLKEVRIESSITAWWSWYLLNLSLCFVVLVMIMERAFDTRPVIFALTCASLTFFVIGILAPAMVIWSAGSCFSSAS